VRLDIRQYYFSDYYSNSILHMGSSRHGNFKWKYKNREVRKMQSKMKFYHKINARILTILLILFAITAVTVSVVSQNSIRRAYEESYTQRVLLTNALMGSVIHSEDVNVFVDLIKNQDEAFRSKQIEFYHDRELFWELQEKDASEEELAEVFGRLEAFYNDMAVFKTDQYWEIVSELKHIKEVSQSTYLYVMADTGLKNKNGKPLYTFIFDAEDDGVFSEDADTDGLGTCDISQDSILEVYRTKKQMEWVSHYDGGYGELYYAYAPIFNDVGEVTAIFGTDLNLKNMNDAISANTFLFNVIFLTFFVVILLFIFIFLRRSITKPLTGLTNTAFELAEGNVYTPTPAKTLKQHGEIGMLAHAINKMSVTYQEMIGSTKELFDAANIGKLDVRNDTSKFKGEIQNVMTKINDTLDATTLYLNSIPESVFIMDPELCTYFRNNKFSDCFGNMEAAEFISKVFDQDDQNKLNPQERLSYLKKQVVEILKLESNEMTVWINNSCFLIIFQEIDLVDEVENSILVIAENITDLMTEKENAQTATRAKSDFLSRMSHEMRTPMNAIIGMTSIGKNAPDIEKKDYAFRQIEDASARLLRLINDILDMSKIEAGKFELKNVPMNIEKMMINVRSMIIEDIEKKKQTFNIKLNDNFDLNYIADDLRLSQVITNLLSNAMKFTPEGGKIELTVEQANINDNISTLRFSVSDTGIGMTNEQITRLFSLFEQAEGGNTRKFGGTGLGLAISKNIVEMMGGRIWVESQPGIGSTFVFEVNLELASIKDIVLSDSTIERTTLKPLDTDAVHARETLDLSGVRIILADDVEINREIFIATLEDTNISIDAAENGLIAVQKFKENPDNYDLIVMDIQMPEMDGYQATRTIRTLDIPKAKTIPIIALTANAFREDIEKCLESGMNDHLAKPIDGKAVIEKIEHYLKEGGVKI